MMMILKKRYFQSNKTMRQFDSVWALFTPIELNRTIASGLVFSLLYATSPQVVEGRTLRDWHGNVSDAVRVSLVSPFPSFFSPKTHTYIIWALCYSFSHLPVYNRGGVFFRSVSYCYFLRRQSNEKLKLSQKSEPLITGLKVTSYFLPPLRLCSALLLQFITIRLIASSQGICNNNGVTIYNYPFPFRRILNSIGEIIFVCIIDIYKNFVFSFLLGFYFWWIGSCNRECVVIRVGFVYSNTRPRAHSFWPSTHTHTIYLSLALCHIEYLKKLFFLISCTNASLYLNNLNTFELISVSRVRSTFSNIFDPD